MIGVSPAPAEARSLRSSSTLSITGMSANRGTRYLASRLVTILPVGELDLLEQRPAQPHGDRALHLVAQVFGIHHRAALECLHHAQHLHRAGFGCTLTSAQVAT